MRFYRSLLNYLLLFAVLPFVAHAQSGGALVITVCVTDMDTSLPIADATVSGLLDESDAVTGTTDSSGCTMLALPISVSNEDLPELVDGFHLSPPYPNPTSGTLTIPFATGSPESITLEIYDIQGRSVTPPLSRSVTSGAHRFDISLGALSPGIYAFRLFTSADFETGTFIKVHGSTSSGAPEVRLSSEGNQAGPHFTKGSQASPVRIEVTKEEYIDLVVNMEVEDGERLNLSLERQNTDTNTPPVIAVLNDMSVLENDTLSVDVLAVDGDGDALTLSVTVLLDGAPANASLYTFTDFGDNTGQFEMMPQSGDTGTYEVTVSADDGQDNDSEVFNVEVESVQSNTPPALSTISDVTLEEGAAETITMTATDADGDALVFTFTLETAGGGAVRNGLYTFQDMGTGSAELELTTQAGDAGTYNAVVSVTDGVASLERFFTVTVTTPGGNVLPVISSVDDQTLLEGASQTINIEATDADGDAITLSVTIQDAEGNNPPSRFFSFTDNDDGTGTLDIMTAIGQAGVYTATIVASDGEGSSEEIFTITVTEEGGNVLPVISSISDQSLQEGASLSVNVAATDANGDLITLSASIEDSEGSSVGAGFFSFVDNSDGTGVLDVTPAVGQSGTYTASIVASDGIGSAEETFTITVTEEGGNGLPVISSINNQALQEGTSLSVNVEATDADGDPITLTVSIEDSQGTSVGAGFFSFMDNSDGTGVLDVTPAVGQSGTYTASIVASDGIGSAEETFTITVTQPGEEGDMVPLIDMGTLTYKGFAGGLYPNASNEMPTTHYQAGIDFANSIEPLNTNGNPDPNGKYVMISLGMSNTTQEFCSKKGESPCDSWTFMGQALADPEVNTSSLVLVNGAKGGQSAEEWVDPNDGNYNRIENEHLIPQGLSEQQVQVAWIKVANPSPMVSLPNAGADAFQLEAQIGDIVRALRIRYPNLKQVFLASRIYAGYAATTLNPEPYAYESGYGVRFAIEAQIDQMDGDGVDDNAGDMDYNGAAAWVAWGAYFWADGLNPRSDGLIWEAQDLEGDGTHPSMFGEEKVGTLLLDFFKSSPHTRCWFLESGGTCQ